MTLNDALKITALLKAQLSDCEQLKTEELVFSVKDYETALEVVLKAAQAHQNETWGH